MVTGPGRPKEAVKAAIDVLDVKDVNIKGKWPHIEWGAVQSAASTTLFRPSTIDQGGTTTCGAISVLEAMAYFRPALYSTLVLAVYRRGQVVDHEGRPWGDTPDLRPQLLEAEPPSSIPSTSIADWMVATSMIAELKDQSTIFDLLGHDDYLGRACYATKQDASSAAVPTIMCASF